MIPDILAAYQRISPGIRETPVALIRDGSTSLYLKLENLQHTGSFKFRGASNQIALLTPEEAAAGVVTASNGNHGLGVAAASHRRGIAAEVFVCTQVSAEKARRIEAFGALLRYAGDDPLTAELAAREAARTSGRKFISPYNDLDVVAGQGTIAVQLLRQLPRLDAVFAAVGGGGLIAGIGTHLKAVSPHTEVVGCWPEASPVMARCLEAGRVIEAAEQPTLSESTAGGLEPEPVTLDLCRRAIDRFVFVSEAGILSAMRWALAKEHWVIEGAAGVALAALLEEAARYRGRNVAVVICGGNVSAEVLRRVRGA